MSRNLNGRMAKLETMTVDMSCQKGLVAPWALEFVRAQNARLVEGRTGELMRKLVGEVDPAMEEIRTMREAKHLTELYPNLDACQRGEARRAERVHALFTHTLIKEL